MDNIKFEEQRSKNSKRKLFTKQEDKLLTEAALYYNEKNWVLIAEKVPGRTPKQCRDRWVNYLQPSLKFTPWTDHEDKLLISLVNLHGTHWTMMKNKFPNRSTNSLKNRYYWLIKNKVNESKNRKNVHVGIKNVDDQFIKANRKDIKKSSDLKNFCEDMNSKKDDVFENNNTIDNKIFKVESPNVLFDEDHLMEFFTDEFFL